MTRNSNVNASPRAYTFPQLQQQHTINQSTPADNPGKQSGRSNCRCKLGLGVNEQTGRLQWCPGFTCCKFFIILPVVMLPLTLVLILLMRMDGMLSALRLQQQQLQDEQQHYVEDYAGSRFEGGDDIANEQLLPFKPHELSEAERLKRCISFKFGLSEGIDMEERDLMKDARTSFLPQDSTALPRECLEILSYGGRLSALDEYSKAEQYLRRRLRRASRNNYRYYRSLKKEDVNNYEAMPDPIVTEDAGDIVESIAGLQSFWNEQGTRESIRQAQATTMLKYMDTNTNPCDDFYKYACGNWEKLHPIPRDKAGFDTFEMLRENLDIVLKQLLESSDVDVGINNKKSKVATISSNTYDQNSDPNTDRLAATAHADVSAGAPAAAAEDSKIVVIRDNSASQSIKSKPPREATAAAADHVRLRRENAAVSVPEQPQQKAATLRRHIISRREAFSRILQRYQRETTNTKRKRLVSQQPQSQPQATVKAAPTKPAPTIVTNNSAQRKAKQLYQSCINSRLLEKRGIEPLLQLIDTLGGWPVLSPHWNEHNFDWLNLTAHLRRYNNDILIVEWVGPDIKNSDENVIQFDQTSLGLPTREYFLQDVNVKYLQAYQRFMSEVMHKLGASHDVALRTASELIAFETQLASITSPAEQRLNVTKLYKRMTLRQLHDSVPQINWQRYLAILQQRSVVDSEQIVIYAIDYMQDLVALLGETKPQTVSNYLLWRFVRHRINNVDDRFEDIKQNFYHALFGREESPSRWKVCIAQVNTNMGMAVGSMFVSKYFDENSKRDTLKMTHELQQAFRDILKSTDWLDANTKYLAELKVNAMSLKIGYPDFILNPSELNEKYAGIAIHPERYFENTLNVLLHTSKTEQNKLHEPVNKTAWQTAPAIVNAYYSRNKNQIMFPAGILQPPFYHRHFPRSLNFGGIGVVIGHELTHGFDDKGRLFDKNGSIHKWWTDAAVRGFDERARCIIAQYSNYTVGEVGIALNGESTQGENIADNGGIRQAFHAYKRWLRDNPKSARDERLPGINMSGEQLFFLNFGQVWCGAMRPEAVRNKLNTAIHSPGKFRVIGTLSNSNDFAREFRCPLGSPMNPEHKCSVW